MNLTKLLAGTTALTLASAGLVVGLTTGAAEASTGTFPIATQINVVASGDPEIVGNRNIAMTVTPATAAPGEAIEVQITSSDLDMPNGPVAETPPNAAELAAVIHLDGVDYTLRGSQNKALVPKNDTITTPNVPIVFKKGWVLSSTPGKSVGVSNNGGAGAGVNTTGTTGLGTTIRGAEATPVTFPGVPAGTLVAPGAGTYTIGLKALVLNLLSTGDPTSSSTPALTNMYDSIFNTTTTAQNTPSGCTTSAGKPAKDWCYGPGGTKGTFARNTATAVNNGLNAGLGNIIFATPVTVTVSGEATAPGKPTNVQGIPGDTKVDVTWAPAPSNGSPITKSVVTSSPGGFTCTVNDATTTCPVTGLTNGTAYKFSVVSTNAIGAGPASDESPAVTPFAPTVPGAPTGVTASAGNALADIEWKAPASNGGSSITSYKVTSSPGDKTCITLGELACLIEGLTNGTAYTFTVTATNAVGTSPASAPSAAVTPSNGSTPTETPSGPSVDTGPRTATSTVKAYCDVSNTGLGALKDYSWPVTLTVSPGAAKPGSTVAVSVSVDGSPINSGPSTLTPNAYRMEATVGFDGKSVQLLGPKNAKTVVPTTGLIFAKSQWPTVAKGTLTLPSETGSFPITIKDLWYNNLATAPGEEGTKTPGLKDIFDNRCNASNKPQTAPKAFTAPTVSVSSDANAPESEVDPETGNGSESDSGGVLADTGPAELVALALLALAALQVGAIVAVRAQRSSPRTKRVRLH